MHGAAGTTRGLSLFQLSWITACSRGTHNPFLLVFPAHWHHMVTARPTEVGHSVLVASLKAKEEEAGWVPPSSGWHRSCILKSLDFVVTQSQS